MSAHTAVLYVLLLSAGADLSQSRPDHGPNDPMGSASAANLMIGVL